MRGLTDNQAQVFDFICKHQELKGYPPTIREIGEAFNLSSTGSVRDYLTALEKKGYISRNSRTSRGIEIIKDCPTARTCQVNIYGNIAAGAALTAAEDHIEGEVFVDRDWLEAEGEVFALTVKGESMIEAGIMDGDLVLIKKQNHSRNGEIVAAIIDEEATLKYFFHEGDRIRLEPANESIEPIYIEPDQASIFIAGVLVASMRKY